MIPLTIAIASAVYGALLARRREGNRLDMAQYAAGFGIMGGLLGVLIAVILMRAT